MAEYIPMLRSAYPWLTAAEEPFLEVIAMTAAKLRLEEGYLGKYGEHLKDGTPRPSALRADRLRTQLASQLEKLGGTPAARMSLGIQMLEAGPSLERWAAGEES